MRRMRGEQRFEKGGESRTEERRSEGQLKILDNRLIILESSQARMSRYSPSIE